MTIKQQLDSLYPQRVFQPSSEQSIPRDKYMVYILTHCDHPIVVGHGKRNRAKVVFDDKDNVTKGHIKAIFVRAYHLYGEQVFERFVIICDSKEEAKSIEKNIHANIGGNTRSLTPQIEKNIFKGISPGSVSDMVIRIALNSSFDGLSDLRLWRKRGILTDKVWRDVADKFQLRD